MGTGQGGGRGGGVDGRGWTGRGRGRGVLGRGGGGPRGWRGVLGDGRVPRMEEGVRVSDPLPLGLLFGSPATEPPLHSHSNLGCHPINQLGDPGLERARLGQGVTEGAWNPRFMPILPPARGADPSPALRPHGFCELAVGGAPGPGPGEAWASRWGQGAVPHRWRVWGWGPRPHNCASAPQESTGTHHMPPALGGSGGGGRANTGSSLALRGFATRGGSPQAPTSSSWFPMPSAGFKGPKALDTRGPAEVAPPPPTPPCLPFAPRVFSLIMK